MDIDQDIDNCCSTNNGMFIMNIFSLGTISLLLSWKIQVVYVQSIIFVDGTGAGP